MLQHYCGKLYMFWETLFCGYVKSCRTYKSILNTL